MNKKPILISLVVITILLVGVFYVASIGFGISEFPEEPEIIEDNNAIAGVGKEEGVVVDRWVAQSFNITNTTHANRDAFLLGVSVEIFQESNTEAVKVHNFLNVSVWSTTTVGAGGNLVLSNTLLSVNDTVNISSIGKSGVWYNITLPKATLINNTDYYLIMYHNNDTVIRWNGTDPKYSGGQSHTSTTDGASWSPVVNDRKFIVWVNSTTPAPSVGNIVLETPADGTSIRIGSQTFRCSNDNSISGNDLANVTFSLWRNDTSVQLNTTTDISGAASTSANETFLASSLGNNSYEWNCEFVDVNSNKGRVASNFTFIVDSIIPTLTLDIKQIYSSTNLDINYSFTENNPQTCWYMLNSAANVSTSCGTNHSITALGGDNNVFVYINDSNNDVAIETGNFTVVQIENLINSTRSTETITEDFSIVILQDSSTLISAIFNYNGTANTFDSSTSNGTSVAINSTIQLPLITAVSESMPWSWNATFSRGSDRINISTSGNQVLERMDFQLCNATYKVPFINYTFKDENTENRIAGRFNPAKFTYSTTSDLLLNRTLTFTNTTGDSDSFGFCFVPARESVFIASDIDYLNGTVQQRNLLNNTVLTNTTTDKTLFLLGTGDGIFVRFNVINLALQPIKEVTVTAEREIGGVFNTVEEGVTDDSGGVTFFLNPDKVHRMTFVKSGFDTLITTITPSSSSFTITLSQIVTTNQTNFFRGISFDILPKQDVLANNTNYTFIFNITSSFFELDKAGFTLANLSGTQLGSASCSISVGCGSSLNISTFNETGIAMNYFWTINGNNTNGTRTWTVSETTGFTSSWAKFKSDFAKLGGSFGGGTNAAFTRAIIAFFIIFALTASVSFFAGVNSPLAIVGMIAIGTGFFDLLDWMPAPLFRGEPVPFFSTIIMGLIFFSFYVMEARK